jgi:hypothetical protein
VRIGELRAFAAYYKSLIRFSPFRFALGSALTMGSAFLSGAGLLLVIPLLHYTGWLPGESQAGLVGGILRHLPVAEGHTPLYATMVGYVIVVAFSGGLA